MNFLAHIYLSDNNDFIKIGNFMADGIRGNDYLEYPEEIKKGIILHRYIDTFTDANKTFRISKHRLHERYGHYSGVIVDILYDHFLAKNWTKYSDESLTSFVFRFYQSLEDNFEALTPKTQRILPIMIEQNWLESYATIEGISKILFQMDYRTKFKSKMQFSVEELESFYDDFENEFTLFFEELRNHVKEKLIELN
ncbi:acyl carrier protein phosphodiesterase [uncultured Flavobacterium sp.]|uniref:acyl carrier protein phosphodiesterase n=1 Tax=uncultured Flavobacterium sp. TaxID=165435 RepID=UPI0030EB57B5|tara:strand:- start:57008 stop:57595 length:588 start_codon:yes stop_codon:yes gene_type:complete